MAAEEMHRWLEQIDGFEGLLMLANEEEGTNLVLTFWQSAEVAKEHQEARSSLRERVAATVNVEIQGTSDYAVAFAHLPGPLQSPRAG
jgi:heme-degrading monooxygenase HmoA